MVTEANIKTEFVVQTLQWGLNRIRSLQLQQLSTKQADIEGAHFDYNRLVSSVQNRADGVIGSGGHFQVIIPTEKKLRFADMKQFKSGYKGSNAQVYNRIMWGVLFGRGDSIRTRLNSGISQSLKENIIKQLQSAIEN